MVSGNSIAEIAALMGDPARANILSALMDGRALTAGELSGFAGVSPQTTSGHLSKLVAAGLLSPEKQGRHRYFRLASPAIAGAMEALMVLAASGPVRHRPVGPKDEALRTARTCYDHIAGRLGTGIADALLARGHLLLDEGSGLVTATGHDFLCDFGIDMSVADGGSASRRPLCRTCLDWSERRPHLAGRLGAAILERSLQLGWVARVPQARALRITRAGERGFDERFGIGRALLAGVASVP